MIRRAAGALLVFAIAGTAAAQAPRQQMPTGTSFASVVAGEIHAVASFTPPEFTLSVRQEDTHLAFYGKEPGRLESVRCERQAAFEFVALANLTGHIQAGICVSEAKRVRTLATAAPRSLEALLAQLGGIDMEQRRKAGLTTTRAEGSNGTEEYAFPVMAIGHGVLVAQTVVVMARGARQAIVVQADTTKLCEPHYRLAQTPLCRDPRQALTDIARRLETRFARQ